MTMCPKCSTEKPPEAFSNDRNRKTGKYPYCKTCVRVSSAEWYANNLTREQNKRKAHSKRRAFVGPKLPALTRCEVSKRWRARNPDKVKAQSAAWRIANRERFREMQRRWALNNPAKARAKNTRYVAIKLRAIPAWVDNSKVLERYAAQQAAQELFGITVHVDHIVPLRSKLVSGLHCESNLQLMPALPNQIKSNIYWPDMWEAA